MDFVTTSFLVYGILQLIQINLSYADGKAPENHVDREYVKNLLKSGEYGEFSELLQVDDVDLEKPEGEADLDDLLLRPGSLEEQERQGINFGSTPSRRWQNHVIPYVIKTEDYSEGDIEIIEKSIESFNEQVKNIQFQKRKDEEDYVSIYAGDGCYSHLGRMGGRNRLSLQAPVCMREGTIQHEMMHTVGFTHEHNSPIRHNFIQVLYENIPKEWHRNYAETSPNSYDVVGKYDYYSIMHYPIKAPSSDKPAFRVLDDDVSLAGIGQRLAMTKYDIEKINNLYSDAFQWKLERNRKRFYWY